MTMAMVKLETNLFTLISDLFIFTKFVTFSKNYKMTTREKLKKMLTDKGMPENQAEKVLEIAIPNIEAVISNGRAIWKSPAEKHSELLYRVMWIYIKTAAKEWIAENAPTAGYRPVFD